MSNNYFKKSGCCLLMAVRFLFLGFKGALKRGYEKLTKESIIAIMGSLVIGVSICWLVSYVRIKTRLTTIEWQRDSLKQKVDSIHSWNHLN